MKLYIVRHGQSTYNAQHLLAGSTDIPLTDLGREQARVAGARAKTLGINLIVSSPLQRAYETACIIADEIGYGSAAIITDSRLQERHFGALEGAPWSEGSIAGTPDLEPREAVLARASAMLDFARERPDSTILFVAHASFVRATLQVLHPDEDHFGDDLRAMKNADIIQLLP